MTLPIVVLASDAGKLASVIGWTIVVIFAITAILTIVGLFFKPAVQKYIHVEDKYLKVLFAKLP